MAGGGAGGEDFRGCGEGLEELGWRGGDCFRGRGRFEEYFEGY